MVKNPPAIWETWVQSLGRGDPLEKDMEPWGWGVCLRAGRQSEGWRSSQTGGQLAGSATTVRSGLVHARPCTSLHLSFSTGPQDG